MIAKVKETTRSRAAESGFTLIEALIAMIILMFGLIAIANLFVVAASSNQIGNYTTVATSIGSDVMEKLKAVPFTTLVTFVSPYDAADPWKLDDWEDGDFGTDVTGSPAPDCTTNIVTKDGCVTQVAGIGNVVTHWKIIDPGAAGTETRFILVRSEVRALLGRSTAAQFATFRACISSSCP